MNIYITANTLIIYRGVVAAGGSIKKLSSDSNF